ncbi:MAG: tRNA (N(6)-L-threonylcarbamoyladenosine(37)-C(2))-methylthiotransferase MtaB [Actinomycetota bacterium]|nr:tRNA (N(6)-L-threonylcarbamoyladenosine(37)-C(2))-methylthiotransferase MtaB [Actinomycetota bacterium]
MKTYALATLGCKVNQYEGDQIKAQLAGLTNVPFGQAADLYIVNTCSVTAEAEAKARQLINRARRAGPGALIVLTGCWPGEQTKRFKSLGVDMFFDNASKADLVKSLLVNGSGGRGDANPRLKTSRTRAFLKVQDGCDRFCSYCSIPLFRGKPASRPIGDVVAEVTALVKVGVPEIVLTGIHLGKYGVDLAGGRNLLVDLMKAILSRTTLARLRLSSIEPREVTDGLIDLMAGEAGIARHLHIPLQSGSDKILSSMNRDYTAGEFLSLVNKLRRRLPDIGLTTDVIAGFPGESDDDFLSTAATIKEAAFSRLHVFKYSARPGTAAATFPGQISPAVKKARAVALKELGAVLAADFAAGFVGRPVSVLVERQSRGQRSGLTSQYVRVKFEQAPKKSDNPIHAVGIKTETDVLIVRKSNG